MLVKYAIIYLLLCFTIGTAIHVENDETYQRPLKNFGTRASELTKEEEKTVESEMFTPKDWCRLYKMEINAKNVEQHEPSNILNCRPAHFGLNESNVVGKLRELEPITACSDDDTKIKTIFGDDLNKDIIIGVVHRGECPFIQKAKNAKKAGVKALIIVDNDIENTNTLLTLIGDGDDEYTQVHIPVVSVLAKEKELLSIAGYYFKMNFGHDMDWKKKENLIFWEEIVKKYPHNPKYKMRLGTAYEIAFPKDVDKAEITYRNAIDDCLPKDPRSIYAYFKLGVLLAKRKNDVNAWEEASSFLKGYKKYLLSISTTMIDQHLLNEDEEDNDERVIPYISKALKKAEKIHGGRKFEEPRTYYQLGRLNEYLKDYIVAMKYYKLAHRAGEKRGDKEMYEQGYTDYMRMDTLLRKDDDDDDEIGRSSNKLDSNDISINNEDGNIKLNVMENDVDNKPDL